MRVCARAHTRTHIHTHARIGSAMRGYVPYGTVFKNGDQTENDVINIASIFSMDSFYCSSPSDRVESFTPDVPPIAPRDRRVINESLKTRGLSFPRYRAARTKSDSSTKRIILRAPRKLTRMRYKLVLQLSAMNNFIWIALFAAWKYRKHRLCKSTYRLKEGNNC